MKKEKKVQSGKAARRKAAIVKAIKSMALPVILCAIIVIRLYQEIATVVGSWPQQTNSMLNPNLKYLRTAVRG